MCNCYMFYEAFDCDQTDESERKKKEKRKNTN